MTENTTESDLLTKTLRSGRIARLSMLGGMAVGLARGAVGSATKVGRVQDGVTSELHRRTARQLVKTFGEMKGLPMKLGQMLSYIETMVPPEYRGIYRDTLAELRVRSKPMSLEAMQEVITDDLGAPPDELFAAFDVVPLAAASIGQVYRAELHDGRKVAVKVQYPGVRKAIESDLKNVDMIMSVFATAFPRMDMETAMDAMTARLLEECDYEFEARNQEEFRRIWADDPEVLVPAVVTELSGPHVLVTELIEGRRWEEMLERSDQAERSRIGSTIFRYFFRSLYGHSVLNADPHPGNYLFLPDGRVAFLDYGCVQRYPDEIIDAIRNLYDVVLAGTGGALLRQAVCEAYGLPDSLDEELWGHVEEYVRIGFEPLTAEEPYRYTPKYLEQLTRSMMDLKMAFSVKMLRSRLYEYTERPGVIFLHRLTFGVASVLGALGAEADWRAVMEREASPEELTSRL